MGKENGHTTQILVIVTTPHKTFLGVTSLMQGWGLLYLKNKQNSLIVLILHIDVFTIFWTSEKDTILL